LAESEVAPDYILADVKYFGTSLHKLERCFCKQGILVTSDLHGYAMYINISFDNLICLFLILDLPYVLDVYALGMWVHSLNNLYVGL
jgi:hypothetical protein